MVMCACGPKWTFQFRPLMSAFGGKADVEAQKADMGVSVFAPNNQIGARSFQFGRASAPIAPQTVHNMRGQNAGKATSSA
jgi:hypothetical protein